MPIPIYDINNVTNIQHTLNYPKYSRYPGYSGDPSLRSTCSDQHYLQTNNNNNNNNNISNCLSRYINDENNIDAIDNIGNIDIIQDKNNHHIKVKYNSKYNSQGDQVEIKQRNDAIPLPINPNPNPNANVNVNINVNINTNLDNEINKDDSMNYNTPKCSKRNTSSTIDTNLRLDEGIQKEYSITESTILTSIPEFHDEFQFHNKSTPIVLSSNSTSELNLKHNQHDIGTINRGGKADDEDGERDQGIQGDNDDKNDKDDKSNKNNTKLHPHRSTDREVGMFSIPILPSTMLIDSFDNTSSQKLSNLLLSSYSSTNTKSSFEAVPSSASPAATNTSDTTNIHPKNVIKRINNNNNTNNSTTTTTINNSNNLNFATISPELAFLTVLSSLFSEQKNDALLDQSTDLFSYSSINSNNILLSMSTLLSSPLFLSPPSGFGFGFGSTSGSGSGSASTSLAPITRTSLVEGDNSPFDLHLRHNVSDILSTSTSTSVSSSTPLSMVKPVELFETLQESIDPIIPYLSQYYQQTMLDTPGVANWPHPDITLPEALFEEGLRFLDPTTS